MLHFHVITLFPEALKSYLESSIVARAIENKRIKVSCYNPRDFSANKHHKVDDKPYGGGPGMVLEALPVLRAATRAIGKKKGVKKIFLSPRGLAFNSVYAKRLARRHKDVLIVAGHYEGVDARVEKILKTEAVSVGPYVLTGGELAALVIVDATSRFVKGVLGKESSLENGRVASRDVYTRPESLTWKKRNFRVPKVLLSGHHKKIEEWKRKLTDVDM
ncbi:MAG TPA: tRNA (guanosine(37)-N1)-methyltransferase TrmD [Candidatus Paceibacterota bacterium]|jgi:tRNA (guanine37-N1)-methyltransferase